MTNSVTGMSRKQVREHMASQIKQVRAERQKVFLPVPEEGLGRWAIQALEHDEGTLLLDQVLCLRSHGFQREGRWWWP